MWENNEIQFARLLCELMASNKDLHLADTAKSMDLQLEDVSELFNRAHKVFEEAKIGGSRIQYEFEANESNERYWLGIRVKPDIQADVGVLHNSDGVSIDVWRCGNEDGPRASLWLTWDDLAPEEETGE